MKTARVLGVTAKAKPPLMPSLPGSQHLVWHLGVLGGGGGLAGLNGHDECWGPRSSPQTSEPADAVANSVRSSNVTRARVFFRVPFGLKGHPKETADFAGVGFPLRQTACQRQPASTKGTDTRSLGLPKIHSFNPEAKAAQHESCTRPKVAP